MTAPRRRFEVIAPDWGQTHLTSDAVVAFVDDELSAPAHDRASRHLEVCPGCAADVAEQRQARSALRSAGGPALSSALLHALHAIPRDAELPGPPPGLAVTRDGRFVQALRVAPDAGTPARSGRSRGRLGAGITVTGLALGAIALTATAVPPDAPSRGVFGGPVLDGGSAAFVESSAARLQASARSAPPVPSVPGADAPGGLGTPGVTGPSGREDAGTEQVLRRLDVIPVAHPASR